MVMNVAMLQDNRALVKLTKRECEILSFIAQGDTSREIGEKLTISRKTVDAHRENIKRKLGANSIAELVQYAIALGLLKPQWPA
ncbi:MAG: LuxR C-terminal-related transcriptional regulator [Acidobacteriota bacterium]